MNKKSASRDARELYPELNDPAKRAAIAFRGTRLRLRLTQKEMAEKIDLNQREVSKIEKGEREISQNLAILIGKKLRIDHKRFLFFIFSLLMSISCFADTCQDWFNQLHLESDKNCLLKCESAMIGMDTFMCHDRCETFCKYRPNPTCSSNKVWESELKNGRPNDWPHEKEIGSPWAQDERKRMSDIFSRLPAAFSTTRLRGIYKLEEPRSFYTLGAISTYLDGEIAFYNEAFDGTHDLTQLLVHEFGHHLHETELKIDFENYKITMGWKTENSRPGNFIRSNAKESAEEDFAVNFETYILDPQKLKTQVPKAYQWMSSHLKNKFKLKECKP